MMTDNLSRDSVFRQRLLRDYDRLIEDIETTGATKGETFCMFITPMDGKLITAALRTARQEQIARHKQTDKEIAEDDRQEFNATHPGVASDMESSEWDGRNRGPPNLSPTDIFINLAGWGAIIAIVIAMIWFVLR